MSGRSSLVARLFWTGLAGGAAAFVYGLPALAATGACFALIGLHHLDRPRRIRSLMRATIRTHAATLALRRRQECFVDAYGNRIDDGWVREREYFAERTVLPALDARGYGEEGDALWDTILLTIERIAAAHPLPDESEAPEDGIAYERFCTARLRAAGWNARPTQASGDQGADIVAEHGGVRLVVQCKRYGKPVGNAAVQEVAAALRYWSGDRAVVVSNAGFTPAARKLAAATNVELLHHDDLADLVPVREVGPAAGRARRGKGASPARSVLVGR
ncbi:restriction endonuclease [Methylobacterium gossipiicola]|uniref:Restriction system protein n=1 Tax=Methylobacterium gossipiicola TaxID=582675 RepID=A0A1I2TB90_9HYPH|nr:restriction endonuclease [Methylobacterium gossipiicola]SFG59571.1 restriction system protein [Methylobacterium gossipiicola]